MHRSRLAALIALSFAAIEARAVAGEVVLLNADEAIALDRRREPIPPVPGPIERTVIIPTPIPMCEGNARNRRERRQLRKLGFVP